MKRFSLLLVVCFSLFLAGCDDTTVKAKTVEGVLLSIHDHAQTINNSASWSILTFKDGREVIVRFGPGDSLYIGHYQEIELNSQGFIVDVKCKSFDKLVAKSSYQDYDPSLTQKLLSEKVTREEFDILAQRVEKVILHEETPVNPQYPVQ